VNEAARQQAIDGLLRRLALAPHADRWVLRGSVLTRFYCAPWPRSAVDIDFLDLDPFDPARTEGQLRALLASPVDDGCRFDDRWSSEVIWAETASPGLRLQIDGVIGEDPVRVQLDVATNDPVVPPPCWVDLPTPRGPVRVLGCARETLLGWKLHGLFEKGLGTFRPKDLHDIALLARGATLDHGDLERATRTAFESRKTPLRWLDRLAAGQMGTSRWSRTKWQRFQQGSPAPVPPLAEIVAEIAAKLGPVLGALAKDGP